MKKSNKALRTLATFFILMSFILSPATTVFADEKPKEATSDSDAADGKDKKKDGEEPDCE